MFLFRRFPIIGWLLVGWLVLALVRSAGAGATATIAGLAVLPLLALKLFFFMMIFGMIMGRFGGGHRHDWGGRRSRAERVDVPETDPEWERNVREARTELDELFPDGA